MVNLMVCHAHVYTFLIKMKLGQKWIMQQDNVLNNYWHKLTELFIHSFIH